MPENMLQYADLRGKDVQGLTALGGQIGGYPTSYSVPSQAPAYNIPVPGQMVGQEAQQSMIPSQAPAMQSAPPAIPLDMGASAAGMAPPEGPYTQMGSPAVATGPVGGSFEPPSGEQMGYYNPPDRPTGQTSDFYNEMLNVGIPEHIAAGFMMNAKDESGFNLTAVGDNGNAKGLLQWNGPRKRAFEERYGDDWSAKNQAEFLKWELEGPENAAWQAIQKTRTAGEAAAAIVNKFERPAEEHRARREAAYLGGQGDTSTTGVAVSSRDGTSSGANTDDSIDQAEAMYGDQKDSRRQKIADGLSALGVGLGQMSRGETVDLTQVTSMIAERHERAKQAMREIYQEKTRKVERNEDITREQQRYDESAAAAINEMNTRHQWDLDASAAQREDNLALAGVNHGYKLEEIHAENNATMESDAAGRAHNQRIAEFMLNSDDPVIQRAGKFMRDSEGNISAEDAIKEANPGTPLVDNAPKLEVIRYEAGIKRIGTEREILAKSRVADQALDQMMQIMEQFNYEIPTGPITKAMVDSGAVGVMQQLGMLDDSATNVLSVQEFLKKGAFAAIPSVKTEGQVTDKETSYFLSALPNLGDSPEGLRLVMQIGKANRDASAQRVMLMDQYLGEHNGMEGFDAFYAEKVKEGNTPIALVSHADLFNPENKTKMTNLVNNGYIRPGMMVTYIDGATGKPGMKPLSKKAYDKMVQENFSK